MCAHFWTCRKPPLPDATRDHGYDRAFRFWRLLAETSAALGQSRALVNTAAPIVLSNALWYPEPDTIAEMSDFYNEQGVLPSCFLSPVLDDELSQTLALTHAGFSRTAQYSFSSVEPTPPSDLNVEQVSWAQARTLGDVIAEKYALSPSAVVVGQTLTLALQLEPALTAFIAYDGAEGKPVGAMVTLESEMLSAFVLETLSAEADTALRARLHFEAETRGKKAFVFEQTETGALELWQ